MEIINTILYHVVGVIPFFVGFIIGYFYDNIMEKIDKIFLGKKHGK